MADYLALYTRVNRLLERRVRQLQRKGRIHIHPSVGNFLAEKDQVTGESLSIVDVLRYHRPLSRVEGMEETVRDSGDYLLRGIYCLCGMYGPLSKRNGASSTGRYASKMHYDEKRFFDALMGGKPLGENS